MIIMEVKRLLDQFRILLNTSRRVWCHTPRTTLHLRLSHPKVTSDLKTGRSFGVYDDCDGQVPGMKLLDPESLLFIEVYIISPRTYTWNRQRDVSGTRISIWDVEDFLPLNMSSDSLNVNGHPLTVSNSYTFVCLQAILSNTIPKPYKGYSIKIVSKNSSLTSHQFSFFYRPEVWNIHYLYQII